jgi:thermitase
MFRILRSLFLCLPAFALQSRALGFTQSEFLNFLSTYETRTYTADDTDWALREMRTFEAWRLFTAKHKVPGEGIVIASPDTGLVKHPAVFQDGTYISNIQLARARDFVDVKIGAADPMTPPVRIGSTAHGTMVAAALIAPPGILIDGKSFPPGVAPGAKLLPLRVANLPVLHKPALMESAIRYAVKHGAHVINISMAGPHMSAELGSAILEAREQGVLVICAAGQGITSIQYPALAAGAFAISASTIEQIPWNAAAYGSKIFVSAPGLNVWHSFVEKIAETDKLKFTIAQGYGTTFASSFVSGTAALWLSYHGRDNLIEKYGASGIADIFEQLVREYGHRTPAGWDTNNYGLGIIDAEALLKAPLP